MNMHAVETSKPSTRQAMATGAGWMVAMRIFDRSLGMLSMVVLARLLLPSDYGLVAMASAFTEVLYLLMAFGFDSVLIQKRDPTTADFNTAWSLNAIFGLIVGLALIVLSPLAAAYFGEIRLEAVMMVLSLGPILGGFSNVGVVEFRKKLEFRKDATLMALRRISGVTVTIVAALALENYWALVLGSVTSAGAGLLLSYYMHPYRPRFDISARREMLGFTTWLFINSVVRYANGRLLDVIIAKQSGPHALGIFSAASEISSLPTTEISAPINRALFPGYAKLNENEDALRQTVLDVFAVLGVVAIPAGVGIAVIAPLLIPLLLGPRWLETIPLIQILAISGVIGVLQNNSYIVYLTKGKPQLTTWIAGGFAILQTCLVIISLPMFGALGAAAAILISRIIFIPIELGMLLHALEMGPRKLTAVLIRPILACLVMAWAVSKMVDMFANLPFLQGLGALLLCMFSGMGVYSLSLLLLWRLVGAPNGGERLFFKLLPGGGSLGLWLDKLLFVK